jgi:hypothetical protein
MGSVRPQLPDTFFSKASETLTGIKNIFARKDDSKHGPKYTSAKISLGKFEIAYTQNRAYPDKVEVISSLQDFASSVTLSTKKFGVDQEQKKLLMIDLNNLVRDIHSWYERQALEQKFADAKAELIKQHAEEVSGLRTSMENSKREADKANQEAKDKFLANFAQEKAQLESAEQKVSSEFDAYKSAHEHESEQHEQALAAQKSELEAYKAEHQEDALTLALEEEKKNREQDVADLNIELQTAVLDLEAYKQAQEQVRAQLATDFAQEKEQLEKQLAEQKSEFEAHKLSHQDDALALALAEEKKMHEHALSELNSQLEAAAHTLEEYKLSQEKVRTQLTAEFEQERKEFTDLKNDFQTAKVEFQRYVEESTTSHEQAEQKNKLLQEEVSKLQHELAAHKNQHLLEETSKLQPETQGLNTLAQTPEPASSSSVFMLRSLHVSSPFVIEGGRAAPSAEPARVASVEPESVKVANTESVEASVKPASTEPVRAASTEPVRPASAEPVRAAADEQPDAPQPEERKSASPRR